MVAKRKRAKKAGSAGNSQLLALKKKIAKLKADFKKQLKKEVTVAFKKGHTKGKEVSKKSATARPKKRKVVRKAKAK